MGSMNHSGGGVWGRPGPEGMRAPGQEVWCDSGVKRSGARLRYISCQILFETLSENCPLLSALEPVHTVSLFLGTTRGGSENSNIGSNWRNRKWRLIDFKKTMVGCLLSMYKVLGQIPRNTKEQDK